MDVAINRAKASCAEIRDAGKDVQRPAAHVQRDLGNIQNMRNSLFEWGESFIYGFRIRIDAKACDFDAGTCVRTYIHTPLGQGTQLLEVVMPSRVITGSV